MELSEIIAAINAHVAGDKAKAKELAKELRANSKDVAQLLINVGAGQKSGETQTKVSQLEAERDDLKEHLEQLTTEYTEFKTRTPDAAAIETRLNTKWGAKLQAKDDEVKATRDTLRKALGGGTMQKVVARLVTKYGVDDDYAREVLAQRHADRIAVGDDAKVGVLQLGETVEYDAATEDEKIDALAADIRKTVPPKFVNTNADTGAGIRGGVGGAVVKTVEQIAQQKRNDPAFSGL
jgi:hypothetical protein